MENNVNLEQEKLPVMTCKIENTTFLVYKWVTVLILWVKFNPFASKLLLNIKVEKGFWGSS